MHRVISNYEYAESDCSILQSDAILESARKAELELNSNVLGKLIQSIWGGKVTYDHRGISVYKHLQKRSVAKGFNKKIENLDEENISEIQSLCEKHPGWLLNASDVKKRFVTLIKFVDSACGGDGIIINGCRLALSVLVNMEPQPTIKLQTYGYDISLQQIKGLEQIDCTIQEIEEAIHLLEGASPCIGHQISKDESSEYFKLPVYGSNVVEVVGKNGEKHLRLISNSCLLLKFYGKSCPSCSYIKKLFDNRSRKRKSLDPSCTPPLKCNIRYLDRLGLEEKIASQKKEFRREIRGTHMDASPSLEFMEEDSRDLANIFESINPNDVPPQMQIMWEIQKKQLSAQSPRGYRWDPRYITYFTVLVFSVFSSRFFDAYVKEISYRT